jgi:Fe-S-cluster containining protein
MTTSDNARSFTIWDYDVQTVKRYLREGECNSCGLCCRTSIQFSVAQPLDSEQLHQGGQKTTGQGRWVEINHNGSRTFYRILSYAQEQFQCRYLDTDSLCEVYPDRSLLCREWPFCPEDIVSFPDCSYQFELVGEWPFAQIKKQNTD